MDTERAAGSTRAWIPATTIGVDVGESCHKARSANVSGGGEIDAA